MATGLMKLPENRVRRNYTGGAGIDRLHGKEQWADNNMPEEWVGYGGSLQSGNGAHCT